MKPTTRDGLLRGGTAAIIRLLILVAAGISAYLLSVSLSGGNAVGCGPGSACDELLQSRWAYVLGIPVSAAALLIDLTLLLATFSCGPKSTPKQRRSAWEILVPCAILVLGAALWFIALQAVVLHRFCPWCMTAHTCGGLAAILLLMRVPVTDSRERREKDPAVSRATLLRLTMIAVLALALFGVAQAVAPRKTFSVSTIPAPTTNATLAVNAPNVQSNASVATATTATARANVTNVVSLAPANPVPPAPASSILGLFGGRVRLDLTEVPVWGSPTAPLKLVSLYDYTCHHCRDTHPHVVELQHLFGDKLAVVSLPMPLDAPCNPLVMRTYRAQTNACIYAKLGLIVWRAKHEAIQPFDDWFFGFEHPPSLTDVTNKAVQLVGTIPFEAASRDPWIEQQLRTDVGIYMINAQEYHNGNMPQFMIGTNIITGTLTTEQLRAVVANHVAAIAPGGK